MMHTNAFVLTLNRKRSTETPLLYMLLSPPSIDEKNFLEKNKRGVAFMKKKPRPVSRERWERRERWVGNIVDSLLYVNR